MTSDVTFTLTWTDSVGQTDLDLYVTGAADSGDAGASANRPERVYLADVQGGLDIRVNPYFVTDPTGSTYTLTATDRRRHRRGRRQRQQRPVPRRGRRAAERVSGSATATA